MDPQNEICSRMPIGWNVKQVGTCFLTYYRQLGFQEIEGSSLLSNALPMTFVMSAGMVQFEKLAPAALPGDRYVLLQNCFRHLDIQQVGVSPFHISLFQMPGAFIFGQIDRQTCIAQIWRLLTQVYGLESQKLYVSYFRGGKVGDLLIPPDEATSVAWQTVGVPADHIFALGSKDNFWRQSALMVGKTNSRKCGPSTEVFFDRGLEYGCGKLDCNPGCSCGRFVEFLNHLFISLQITELDRKLIPLENPFTETVIGQERLTALLNQATSVYEVDTIRPLVKHIGCFQKETLLDIKEQLVFQWVIVDHLRALLFLAQDYLEKGYVPVPGKGGREHLLRILIRGLLTSQRLLGISDRGFLRSLTMMAGEIYPHLMQQTQQCFIDMVEEENTRFDQTVRSGMSMLEGWLDKGLVIKPIEVVRMEKEGGIPIELLRYIFWQKRIPFDLVAYHGELKAYLEDAQAQSKRSRRKKD